MMIIIYCLFIRIYLILSSPIYLSPSSSCYSICNGSLDHPFQNLLDAINHSNYNNDNQEILLMFLNQQDHFLLEREIIDGISLPLLNHITVNKSLTIRPLFCDEIPDISYWVYCFERYEYAKIYIKSENIAIIIQKELKFMNIILDGTEKIDVFNIGNTNDLNKCMQSRIRCCSGSQHSQIYPSLICMNSGFTPNSYQSDTKSLFKVQYGQNGALVFINVKIFYLNFLQNQFITIQNGGSLQIYNSSINLHNIPSGLFDVNLEIPSLNSNISVILKGSLFTSVYIPQNRGIIRTDFTGSVNALITDTTFGYLNIISSSYFRFKEAESSLTLQNVTFLHCDTIYSYIIEMENSNLIANQVNFRDSRVLMNKFIKLVNSTIQIEDIFIKNNYFGYIDQLLILDQSNGSISNFNFVANEVNWGIVYGQTKSGNVLSSNFNFLNNNFSSNVTIIKNLANMNNLYFFSNHFDGKNDLYEGLGGTFIDKNNGNFKNVTFERNYVKNMANFVTSTSTIENLRTMYNIVENTYLMKFVSNSHYHFQGNTLINSSLFNDLNTETLSIDFRGNFIEALNPNEYLIVIRSNITKFSLSNSTFENNHFVGKMDFKYEIFKSSSNIGFSICNSKISGNLFELQVTIFNSSSIDIINFTYTQNIDKSNQLYVHILFKLTNEFKISNTWISHNIFRGTFMMVKANYLNQNKISNLTIQNNTFESIPGLDCIVLDLDGPKFSSFLSIDILNSIDNRFTKFSYSVSFSNSAFLRANNYEGNFSNINLSRDSFTSSHIYLLSQCIIFLTGNNFSSNYFAGNTLAISARVKSILYFMNFYMDNTTFDDSKFLKLSTHSSLNLNQTHFKNLSFIKSGYLFLADSNSDIQVHHSMIEKILKEESFSGGLIQLFSSDFKLEYSKIMNSQTDLFNVYQSELNLNLNVITYSSDSIYLASVFQTYQSLLSVDSTVFQFDGIKQKNSKLFILQSTKLQFYNSTFENYECDSGNIFYVNGGNLNIENCSFINLHSKTQYLINLENSLDSSILNDNYFYNVSTVINSANSQTLNFLNSYIESIPEVNPIINLHMIDEVTLIGIQILNAEVDVKNLIPYAIGLININNFTGERIFAQGFLTSYGSLFYENAFTRKNKFFLINSIFSNNIGMIKGGAISLIISSECSIVIENSLFEKNQALKSDDPESGRGGAIYFESIIEEIEYILKNNQFRDNFAIEYAGSVYSKNIQPYINNSTFVNNTILKKGTLIFHDLGSNPARLCFYDENSQRCKNEFSNFIINFNSGDTQNLNLLLALFDVYNNRYYLDDSYFLIFSGPPNYFSIYPSAIKSHEGLFHLKDLTVLYTPGSKLSIEIIPNFKIGVENDTSQKKQTEGEIGIFGNRILTFDSQENVDPYKIESNLQESNIQKNIVRKLKSKSPLPFELTLKVADCPYGSTILENQACITCPEGYFLIVENINSRENCKICDTQSMHCLGGSKIAPRKGFWRLNSTSDIFTECKIDGSCLDGLSENGTLNFGYNCDSKYKGNVCSKCVEGFGKRRDNNECFDCSKDYNIYFALFLTLLISLAVTLYSVSATITNVKKYDPTKSNDEEIKNSICTRIFMNYIQMVVLIARLNIEWPNVLSTFFTANEALTVVKSDIMSMDCLFTSRNEDDSIKTTYLKLIMSNLSPIGYFVLVLIFWIINYIVKRKEKKFSNITTDIIMTMVVLIFTLQPDLIQNNLRMFDCQNLYRRDKPEYYLIVDLDIKCDSYLHSNWSLKFALPFLLLWSVTLPLLVIYKLFKNKKTLSDPTKHPYYFFLYLGYKVNFYFWEFVIMFRKYALLLVVIYKSQISSGTQLYLAQIIIMISYLLQSKVSPYKIPIMNRLEQKSLASIYVIALCSTYFVSPVQESFIKVIVLIVVIASNSYFILEILRLILRFKIEIWKKNPNVQKILKKLSSKKPKTSQPSSIDLDCTSDNNLLQLKSKISKKKEENNEERKSNDDISLNLIPDCFTDQDLSQSKVIENNISFSNLKSIKIDPLSIHDKDSMYMIENSSVKPLKEVDPLYNLEETFERKSLDEEEYKLEAIEKNTESRKDSLEPFNGNRKENSEDSKESKELPFETILNKNPNSIEENRSNISQMNVDSQELRSQIFEVNTVMPSELELGNFEMIKSFTMVEEDLDSKVQTIKLDKVNERYSKSPNIKLASTIDVNKNNIDRSESNIAVNSMKFEKLDHSF